MHRPGIPKRYVLYLVSMLCLISASMEPNVVKYNQAVPLQGARATMPWRTATLPLEGSAPGRGRGTQYMKETYVGTVNKDREAMSDTTQPRRTSRMRMQMRKLMGIKKLMGPYNLLSSTMTARLILIVRTVGLGSGLSFPQHGVLHNLLDTF